MSERTGLKPSATRLLRALQDAQRDGLTNVEIAQPDVAGLGYSARLVEVEKYLAQHGLGHVERRRLTNSRWRYILIPAAGVGAALPEKEATGANERGVDSGGPSDGEDRDQDQSSISPSLSEHGPGKPPSEPAARLFDPPVKHAA